MQNKLPQGQIGLLLLVIMGVIVALVMSIASRSLSDTVLSRQERESSAAFSVAETGVEQAMAALQSETAEQITGSLSGLSGTVTGDYIVKPTASYGLYVREGETAHLNVTDFSGDLTIYWTRKIDKKENITTCTEGSGMAPAAIEVSQISVSGVNRSYYNPNQSGLTCSLSGNGFLNTTLDGGQIYRSKITINILASGNVTSVRVKPIYTDATIEVSGSNLKNQLYLIQSKALTGDAQKEIEVKRGLDSPASIFDFAVFSAGSIGK